MECGPHVMVDEDGCCAGCGCDAMGSHATKVAKLWDAAESPVAKAERAISVAALKRHLCRERVPCSCNEALDAACDRLLAARRKAKK